MARVKITIQESKNKKEIYNFSVADVYGKDLIKELKKAKEMKPINLGIPDNINSRKSIGNYGTDEVDWRN